MTSVYSLLDWQFWLFSLLFATFGWFVLRGLGYMWLRSLQLPKNFSQFDWLVHQVVLFLLGLASFTISGLVFAQLNARSLQWIVIMIGVLGSVLAGRQTHKQLKPYDRSEKVSLWLIALGACLQLLAVVGSGIRFGNQIGFYFTNAQDGMMHLSFIQSLTDSFPPVRPELSNQPLTNYHYFTDLLLGEQTRMLGTPIVHSFFQYWPIVLSLIAGILVMAVIREITNSSKATWFGILIWYASGELAYLWNLIFHQSFNWNITTIENSADQFLNLPQMFAKVLIFAAYYTALRWYKEQQQKTWFFATLIFVIVSTGFKVYFGLFNLALLLTLLITGIINRKILRVTRQQLLPAVISLMLPITLTVLATLVIFFTVSDGTSHLNWVPLVWPKLLLSAQHLDFVEWWLRMQVYEAANSWKGMLTMNVVAVIIALTSMVGTKLIGVWQLWPTRRNWWWQVPLFLAITAAFTVGLNTLQDPGGFNTYNFVLVGIQPLVILTAVTLGKCWQRSWWGKLIVLVILLAGVARPLANSSKYLQTQIEQRSDATYSAQQLSALSWVANNTTDDAMIQALATNQQNQQSAFISFFSERQTYLAAENITRSHSLDYESRQNILKQATAATDWQLLRDGLSKLGIDYLYIDLLSDQVFYQSIPELQNHSVYQNETISIIAL